uniref:DUF4286 family protein n=1 Tax=Roseihalotalea indica TaxID=2867963 RepID=A0AA49JEA8_9BACT|nr:DUF4286 family protein [Tunicatimonas sp. TK19036]
MILYNVTVNVEHSIEKEWLQWMRTEHILDIINTGLFQNAKIFRLLNVEQSEGTSTYAIQYFAKSQADFKQYEQEHAPALREEQLKRFGNRALAFRTLMEEV